MKKVLFSIFMLFITVSSVSAQENITNQETTDIREVKVRYCNDPANTDQRSLFIDAEIDKKSVICIDFINTARKTAKIGMSFVDGTITDDVDQKKACLAEWEKTNFWQYVSNYPEKLEIAPNSVKRVFVDLLYSGGFAGTSYGCLTYHALGDTGTQQNMNGTMFNVFSRVGSFIDAFVAGEFNIKLITTPIVSDFYTNIWDNPNFIVYKEWSWKEGFWKSSFWNYKAKIDVTNTGNIAVTGDVQITWKDRYILQDTTTLNDQIFLPNQTRSFEVTLPWYTVRLLWGVVNVSAHIEYEPIYLWTYALTAPKEVFMLDDSTSVIFFPWIILFALVYFVIRYHQKYTITINTIKAKWKEIYKNIHTLLYPNKNR